jgi:hypothetical protein
MHKCDQIFIKYYTNDKIHVGNAQELVSHKIKPLRARSTTSHRVGVGGAGYRGGQIYIYIYIDFPIFVKLFLLSAQCET